MVYQSYQRVGRGPEGFVKSARSAVNLATSKAQAVSSGQYMLVLAVGNGARRRRHSQPGYLEMMQMDVEEDTTATRDGRKRMASSVKLICSYFFTVASGDDNSESGCRA